VIELVREVPEAMKPKKIAVNSATAPTAIEHRAADAA
jgi:molecular chaperone IbpA